MDRRILWAVGGFVAGAALATAIGLTAATRASDDKAPPTPPPSPRSASLTSPDPLPGPAGASAENSAGNSASEPLTPPDASPAIPPGADSTSLPSSTAGADFPAVAASARPTLPPGQVWQCVSAGQRVFSDTPCGEHASIRQLSELNLIDLASPPAYGQGPLYPPPPPSAAYAPDLGGDAYADQDLSAGPGVIVIHERGRHDHLPRHPHNERPRRY